MFLNHVSRELSSYCNEELPPDEAARVAAHLEKCQRCRRKHANTASTVELLGYLKRVPAPDSLWDDLERRRSRPPPAPDGDFGASAWLRWRGGSVAAVVALLLALAALGALRFARESPDRTGTAVELDLGAYLRPVQAALPGAGYRELARAAPGFNAGEREDALLAGGLTSIAHTSPLPGYHLQSQHIGNAGIHRVVQLIYSNGTEAFAVFVAPALVNFRFGSPSAIETEVQGIQCAKVDCPKQETYAFQEGSHRYVLVSKSLDAARAVTVMRYFIGKQKRAVDNDARQTRNFVR